MTATQKQTAVREASSSDLMRELINRPVSDRHRAINNYFTEQSNIDKIEELLPPQMKGQGARLAKRAMLTFARKPELADCPPAEFVRCVLEAAELGLAIDGKLCYVVKYKGTWQCQPDYKGIVAVARRTGRIVDVWADVVREGDSFSHRRIDDRTEFAHEYALGEQRGEVIGAYSVVKLPGGHWRCEVMDRSELDRIQNRAPSKSGPWSTDADEMRKKTVIRRCLKLYCDDPGLARALEVLDELDEITTEEAKERLQRARVGRRSSLTDSLPPEKPAPADDADEFREAEAARGDAREDA